MAAESIFFRDLAFVFLAAVAGGALARLAGQPLVLGYVLGGILISPLTPGPAVSDLHTFELFAEIGVILLMFSIGIEFSVRDLLRVKWVALLGGRYLENLDNERFVKWNSFSRIAVAPDRNSGAPTVYIDADEHLLREWYVKRFLAFRDTALLDPKSYFRRYATLSDEEATQTALGIWTSINGRNLHENILPTRQRADLILTKGGSHLVEEVALRRL